MEPQTYNNDAIRQRLKFATALPKRISTYDFIVYYDETIVLNVYCKRVQERPKIGARASAALPPSNGANLLIQCAVATEVGLVHHRFERGT